MSSAHSTTVPSFDDIVNQDTNDMFNRTVTMFEQFKKIGPIADAVETRGNSALNVPSTAVGRKIADGTVNVDGSTTNAVSIASNINGTNRQNGGVRPKKQAKRKDSTRNDNRSRSNDFNSTSTRREERQRREQQRSSQVAVSMRNDGIDSVENNFRFAYDACGRSRTFHELVHFTLTYDKLNRDERMRVIATAKESLTPAEKALCEGAVTRRPVRDIVRALCYGARANIDFMREITLRRMEHLGFKGWTTAHITDAVMIKHIDLWYDYANIDSCEWFTTCVLSDDVRFMMNTNHPIRGRACKNCVNAVLRLCRSGLCYELARDITVPSQPQSLKPPSSAMRVGQPTTHRNDSLDEPTKRQVTKNKKAAVVSETPELTSKIAKKRKASGTFSSNEKAAKVVKLTSVNDGDVKLSMPKLSDDPPFLQQQRQTISTKPRTLAATRKEINKDQSPQSPMEYTDSEDDEDLGEDSMDVDVLKN